MRESTRRRVVTWKKCIGPAGNGSEEFCGKLGVALKQTNRYSVVGSACDGVRAISLLKELKPDLLVVDLMLPQADGLSVLKARPGWIQSQSFWFWWSS